MIRPFWNDCGAVFSQMAASDPAGDMGELASAMTAFNQVRSRCPCVALPRVQFVCQATLMRPGLCAAGSCVRRRIRKRAEALKRTVAATRSLEEKGVAARLHGFINNKTGFTLLSWHR